MLKRIRGFTAEGLSGKDKSKWKRGYEQNLLTKIILNPFNEIIREPRTS